MLNGLLRRHCDHRPYPVSNHRVLITPDKAYEAKGESGAFPTERSTRGVDDPGT